MIQHHRQRMPDGALRRGIGPPPAGTGSSRRFRTSCTGVLALIALLGGACGTRVDGGPDSSALGGGAQPYPSAVASAASGTGAESLAGVAPQSAAAPGTTGAPNDDRGGVTVPRSGSDRGSGSAGPSAGGREKSPGATASGGPSGAGAAGGVKSPPTTEPVGAGAPAGQTPTPPVLTSRSPAVVGTVGTFSGPLGGVAAPILQGLQTWVRAVNARGGVNGHEVQLIVYDDGGDTARHRAQVQEAVERRRVIALIQVWEATGGRGSIEYINAHRVPVIGSEGGSQWMYESPMYFPQQTTGNALFQIAMYSLAHQVLPLGKKKVALIACAEIQPCAEYLDYAGEAAAQSGLDVVYKGRSSVAQPDFTAECLSAKNAGAEIIDMAIDSNSISRIASSCARQGYRPIFGTSESLIVDGMKNDPNLAGMIGKTTHAPYFQTGTPATDEYHRALKNFGGNIGPGVGPATGWVMAKLFERAAANLPEPPTSEAVLAGLYSIKGDTLGGLTAPLLFIEGRPAPVIRCWFDIVIKDKAWRSPDGFRQHCKD